MTLDRRLYPANARVAHASVAPPPSGVKIVEGTEMSIQVPVAAMRAEPAGSKDKELVFGDRVTVLEDHAGWSFCCDLADGYVGYVQMVYLGVASEPTHLLTARTSHLYAQPDFKSEPLAELSFGSKITVVSTDDRFCETVQGRYLPKRHLAPLDAPRTDPISIAKTFLQTPYVWGGNTGFGIDCSGLIQAVWHACGQTCPRDSDMQETALGHPLNDSEKLKTGDLVFWKGHVAMALDDTHIIHANAYHMNVAIEELETAKARILDQGDGAVTSRRRDTRLFQTID